ncbi:M1 family peptidase [Filobacillus milosensis]|uniref:M1 family peptidase n=1 Tax=Filobacillus milosensis TaxID=94137 RepID=A0A4Y8IP85_9BACI|nr:M1 family metallopeptidase [Filobacillus milosensis]TFB22128.1 M1 family peptidase [Filobacillus milosensis]
MKKIFMVIFILVFLAACTDREKKNESESNPDEHTQQEEQNSSETQNNDTSNDDTTEEETVSQKNKNFTNILKELQPSEIDQEAVEAFTAQTPEAGNYATYDIELNVNEEGWIDVVATIQVENQSKDEWDQVAFYFIPQAFLEEHKPSYSEDSGQLENFQVTHNNQKLNHKFEKGYFTVDLEEKMTPESSKTLTISYRYLPALNGIRLKRTESSIVLAQWYPMLATYQHVEWNINAYEPAGESYFTSFGQYHITITAPDNYYLASTAVNENHETTEVTRQLTAEQVPDFLIGLFDKDAWGVLTDKVNEQTLRLFYEKENKDIATKTLKSAKQTLGDFQSLIGPYPYQELDILMNGGGMEYPGVIEVSTADRPFAEGEHTLIHEVAHQWFYFQVINDPFNEGWLDESLTELATEAYLMKKYNDEEAATEFSRNIGGPKGSKEVTVNQPLDEFEKGTVFKLVYGDAVVRLYDFFEKNGGPDAIFKFLNAYYEKFQHKQVTTQEFVRFFQTYFEEDYSRYLDWFLEYEK